VNPTLTTAFFTGAGYFVQAKVVTTIAEDQAPGMSQMILSFGLFSSDSPSSRSRIWSGRSRADGIRPTTSR